MGVLPPAHPMETELEFPVGWSSLEISDSVLQNRLSPSVQPKGLSYRLGPVGPHDLASPCLRVKFLPTLVLLVLFPWWTPVDATGRPCLFSGDAHPLRDSGDTLVPGSTSLMEPGRCTHGAQGTGSQRPGGVHTCSTCLSIRGLTWAGGLVRSLGHMCVWCPPCHREGSAVPKKPQACLTNGLKAAPGLWGGRGEGSWP